METRANFVLIGIFTLAVVVGVFGFVYWFQNIGGAGERAFYRLQFEGSVSGLGVGGSVLFNGIRVGEVINLKLNPEHPEQVTATVSIDKSVAMRPDTQVGLEFRGLTGIAAVALKGGSPSSPPLAGNKDNPPLLIAPPGATQDLTQAARDALRRLDEILTDNAKPLHTAISGLGTFADMLGRNSDRLEGVIGGLERLTGADAPKQPPSVYDLTAPTTFPPFNKPVKAQLIVPDPAAILVFDTQKILIRSASGTYSNVENAQWADNLPKLMQAKIVQSFENAHQLRAVSRPIEQLTADYRLELGIRSFQISPEPTPTAVVEFSARLVNEKGSVTNARIFNVSMQAKSTQGPEAVAALNEAFSKAAEELVVWTVGLI